MMESRSDEGPLSGIRRHHSERSSPRRAGFPQERQCHAAIELSSRRAAVRVPKADRRVSRADGQRRGLEIRHCRRSLRSTVTVGDRRNIGGAVLSQIGAVQDTLASQFGFDRLRSPMPREHGGLWGCRGAWGRRNDWDCPVLEAALGASVNSFPSTRYAPALRDSGNANPRGPSARKTVAGDARAVSPLRVTGC